jgi:hypothetical protein
VPYKYATLKFDTLFNEFKEITQVKKFKKSVIFKALARFFGPPFTPNFFPNIAF